MYKRSYWENIMLALIKAEKLPEPIQEYRFCEDRKWRADFVWLTPGQPPSAEGASRELPQVVGGVGSYQPRGVMLEVEGMPWGGRHTSGNGFMADIQKYNEAALRGYLLLRVTPTDIKEGRAIPWLRRALNLG